MREKRPNVEAMKARIAVLEEMVRMYSPLAPCPKCGDLLVVEDAYRPRVGFRHTCLGCGWSDREEPKP